MSIYFLVGPTASGKTDVSIKLAKKLNAEIISCDSMSVYKGMDILTSKPTKTDRAKVKHHLIDIISPVKEFSVAEYRALALEAIEDILKRGKSSLFVGGSGLYVKAIVDGLFPSGKKDEDFRRRQESLTKKYGKAYLYNRLKRIDPIVADKIHTNDLRRIIRALEIYHTEKKRPSELKKETEPIKYKTRLFGMKIDRDALYKNIEHRIEEMFKRGIVEEVKKLSKMRLSITARGALGYKEILGYLKGEYSLEEAKDFLKKNTRHFAKRQMTWFCADKRIQWLNLTIQSMTKVSS
ncbi:tRNA (adenosine(37)-N6)-dimethylallyltransferase MiaA [Candidatus Omnitrophota bacterium]